MYSTFFQNALRSPAWLAVFISLLLSMLNVINDDSINTDGILYIEAANLFLEQGWQASLDHYKWPFYQILIAIISKLTFLDLEHSAYLLNAALLGGLAFVFIRCSEYMGGDKYVSLATLAIFITHLNLNGYRELIIRDFGYWCFFFVAFLMLLKFYKSQHHRYLLFYTGSMLVATLFRIEGIIFVVLGPLVLLWHNNGISNPFKSVLVGWGPLMFFIIIIALMFLGTDAMDNIGRLSDPFEHLSNIINNLMTSIKDKGKILEETVLVIYARNLGTESFVAILLMILVTKLASATGYFSVLLSIYTFTSKHLRTSIIHLPVWLWFVLLNVFVLSGFLLSEFFLSGRYAITFALLLCLPASVALASFFRSDNKHLPSKSPGKIKALRAGLVFVLVYLLLDGVTSFSPGQGYRRDAADWMSKNIATEKRLLSNDDLMFYYSGRLVPRDELFTVYKKMRLGELPEFALTDYDVAAIRVGRKQSGFREKVIFWLGSKPVYQTKSPRGDMVLVFKLRE